MHLPWAGSVVRVPIFGHASCHVLREKDAYINKGIKLSKENTTQISMNTSLCNNDPTLELFAGYIVPKNSAHVYFT